MQIFWICIIGHDCSNENVFRAPRINVFARFPSDFSSNVTVTCTGHHYRICQYIHTDATRPLVFFSVCLHTPHGANAWTRVDRRRRSIVTHAQGDGKYRGGRKREWRNEFRPTEQPTNRATDWLTNWLTGKFIESISSGKECANDAGVNKDPRRRIRYCQRGDSR